MEKRRRAWISALTGLAAAALMANFMTIPAGASDRESALASMQVGNADDVKYAGGEMDAGQWVRSEEYRDWLETKAELVKASGEIQDKLTPFYQSTMKTFLQDDGKKNSVYSPANVYLELAMLAECSGGETRAELLKLLGAENMEEVQKIVGAFWAANEAATPTVKVSLANSLWMNRDIQFKEDTIGVLADKYHADTFSGDLAGAEANEALHSWINNHTGNLLKDQADSIQMDRDTVMALVSALYLKAGWTSSFDPSLTTTETFHGTDGDQQVSMMHQSLEGSVMTGDGFRAVSLPLSDLGDMVIFLPDEGKKAGDLLDNEDVYELLKAGDAWENSQEGEIRLALPKFDVTSDQELSDGLKNLGVTGLFTDTADFTPLTDTDSCYVSSIEHAARVKTDEEGIEAAAYTIAMIKMTAYVPQETIDFTVDRPFLFAVRGEDGTLLFSGIVNQPEGN